MPAPKALNGLPARYFATPPTWNDKEAGPLLVDQNGRLQMAVGALATGQTYTITNPPADTRTLDVSAGTITDLKNFVATMVKDLKAVGIFS